MQPDPELIERAENLLAGATPGPWRVNVENHEDQSGERWTMVEVLAAQEVANGNATVATLGDDEVSEADAALIVWLRNNARALIGRCRPVTIRRIAEGHWDVIDTDGSVMTAWQTEAQAQDHADQANAALAAADRPAEGEK